MKIKKGYKVVKEKNGKFYSSVWGTFTEYKVGVFVEKIEECGPLTVFKHKNQAIDFANSIGFWFDKNKGYRLYIFKCKYLPSDETKIWDIHGTVLNVKERIKNNKILLAKSVKLLDKEPMEVDR